MLIGRVIALRKKIADIKDAITYSDAIGSKQTIQIISLRWIIALENKNIEFEAGDKYHVTIDRASSWAEDVSVLCGGRL